jgi:hypothetical protein
MWRTRAALLGVLCALNACAGAGSPVYPPASDTSAAISYSPGWLHVEPFEVVFTTTKSPAAFVRVWQRGFRGKFKVSNGCRGVDVTLQRRTRSSATVWKVRPDHAVKESCTVAFTGTRGPRGTGDLHVRVLHGRR